MAKFTDVVIDYVGDKVTCDPLQTTVYYDHPSAADSVRWVVQTFPDNAERVELQWEVEAPFRDFGASLHNGKIVLLGNGNKAKRGSYKYTIVFLDAADEVVADLDPMIVNEPQP